MRVLLCVWFVVALAAVMTCEVTYGWNSAPIDHGQSLAAWLALWSSLWFAARRERLAAARLRDERGK